MRHTTHRMVQTFGALMGLAGLEHGIGEILQGHVLPGGLLIQSWPRSEFFRSLGGEPALTVVPDLFWTGILAVVFSLGFGIWAWAFSDQRWSGSALALWAVGMLLFGGGIFPPILGMLIGLLAARIRNPVHDHRERLSRQRLVWVARLWPWLFGACLVAWLALCPGLSLLAYYFNLESPSLTVVTIMIVLATSTATVVLGLLRDARPVDARPSSGSVGQARSDRA